MTAENPPLGVSASATPAMTPEAAEALETPPSFSPAVPFDDGEGRGLFLFDRNDGQGVGDREPGEDGDTMTVATLLLRRREPAEFVWPVRPVTVEVVIPSKRASPPPSPPAVPFDDREGSGFLFDRNDSQGTSDQESSEDEDTIVVVTSPLRRREPAESVWPVRPVTVEVVIPSKRVSRKRQASVSPERPSRARNGGRQRRQSLRSRPISTEATLSSDDEPLPAHRRRRGRLGRPARVERQTPAVSPTRSPSAEITLEVTPEVEIINRRYRSPNPPFNSEDVGILIVPIGFRLPVEPRESTVSDPLLFTPAGVANLSSNLLTSYLYESLDDVLFLE
jgi:hypothetical protein